MSFHSSAALSSLAMVVVCSLMYWESLYDKIKIKWLITNIQREVFCLYLVIFFHFITFDLFPCFHCQWIEIKTLLYPILFFSRSFFHCLNPHYCIIFFSRFTSVLLKAILPQNKNKEIQHQDVTFFTFFFCNFQNLLQESKNKKNMWVCMGKAIYVLSVWDDTDYLKASNNSLFSSSSLTILYII